MKCFECCGQLVERKHQTRCYTTHGGFTSGQLLAQLENVTVLGCPQCRGETLEISHVLDLHALIAWGFVQQSKGLAGFKKRLLRANLGVFRGRKGPWKLVSSKPSLTIRYETQEDAGEERKACL